MLAVIVAAESTKINACFSIKYACCDRTYVFLRAWSTSVTIVFDVPFGPRPVLTNNESTTGNGLPTGVAAVVVGFGVVTLESLLFLYMSRLACFIVCISLSIQSSFDNPSNPLKFVFT